MKKKQLWIKLNLNLNETNVENYKKHQIFFSVGFPCPMNYNPADHYIHTLAIMPANQEECKEKSKVI